MKNNECKSCNETKSIENFYKSTRTTSGYRNTCKQCCAKQASKRYDETKNFVGHNQSNLPLPSQKWLKDNFDYHEDGHFIRLKSRGQSKCGSVIKGKLEKHGYLRLNINYSTYLLHRLIWKWHYGTEPEFIDHKDKVRANCKIDNLRVATKNENARNQLLPSNNTSGFIGVRWRECNGTVGRWISSITVNCKRISMGHDSLLLAVNWYNKMALELHGKFAVDKIKHNNDKLKELGLI